MRSGCARAGARAGRVARNPAARPPRAASPRRAHPPRAARRLARCALRARRSSCDLVGLPPLLRLLEQLQLRRAGLLPGRPARPSPRVFLLGLPPLLLGQLPLLERLRVGRPRRCARRSLRALLLGLPPLPRSQRPLRVEQLRRSLALRSQRRPRTPAPPRPRTGHLSSLQYARAPPRSDKPRTPPSKFGENV